MNFVKKHVLLSILILIILLTLLFILGETAVREVARYVPPPQTLTAAVSDFNSSLVAHYTFDNTTNDSAGSNHGTINGGATYVDGKIDKAIQLDGVNDYVSAPVGVIAAGQASVCAWVYPESVSASTNSIVDNSNFKFGLYGSNSGVLYTTLSGPSATFNSNTIPPVLNKWQHICGTIDASGTGRVYVNGVESGSKSLVGVPTTSAWSTGIGVRGTLASQFFDGFLDDVRIYNRAISLEEVKQLYALAPAAGNEVVIGEQNPPASNNQNSGTVTSPPTGSTEPAQQIIDGKTLTVNKSGAGQGVIVGQGIQCGADCSEVYSKNSWVYVTPQASSGSAFAKWRGGVCETVAADGKCTVIMRNDIEVVPIFGVLPTRSGNTLTAASCEMSDVQVAINQAQDGDTVKVPPGICTWTTTVEMGAYSYATKTAVSKAITLEGAGVGKTVIVDNIVPISGKVNTSLLISIQTGKPIRITGFTFDGLNSVKGYGAMNIGGPRGTAEVLFRVDHNTFSNLTNKGISVTSAYGLIDGNTFIPLYPHVTNGVSINGDDYDARTSNISWSRPQRLGSDQAVYMENNKFLNSVSANGAFDAYTGARYVFRYNDVVGTHVGHHGFDSSVRGGVDFEIYNNTFTNPADALHRQAPIAAMVFRSGSGVVFNNFITPPVGNPNLSGYSVFGKLQSYRSLDFYKPGGSQPSPGFTCDGTSIWDGNSPDILDQNGNGMLDPGDKTSGYPCKDQIGRTGGFDAKGYQTLSPVYSWNNNFNGNIGGHLNVDDGGKPANSIIKTHHILEGRDYFNGISKPGYKSYTCPHPLSDFSGGCDSTKTGVEGYNTLSKDVPTCTSFNYSSWGICANGTQARSITSTTPASCTGGSPETLVRSCTVTPQATSTVIVNPPVNQLPETTIPSTNIPLDVIPRTVVPNNTPVSPITPAQNFVQRFIPSFTSTKPINPSTVTKPRTSSPFVPLPELTPEETVTTTKLSFTEQVRSIFSYILQRIQNGFLRIFGR